MRGNQNKGSGVKSMRDIFENHEDQFLFCFIDKFSFSTNRRGGGGSVSILWRFRTDFSAFPTKSSITIA